MDRVGTKQKFCIRILIGTTTVANKLEEPRLSLPFIFNLGEKIVLSLRWPKLSSTCLKAVGSWASFH